MDREQSEEYVYDSYNRAKNKWDFNAPDSEKRSPGLTEPILKKLKKAPCVVVTGSKGKGSVSCMITNILMSKWKVGLHTSPHIDNFCERFRINMKQIEDDDFVSEIAAIREYLDPIEASLPDNKCISPIGIQAVLALDYFGKNNTDFNVLECGKGAKYDDIPRIPHEYAVINSIFLEHTRELGSTLLEIADNKSYVITGSEKCVFVAQQEKSVTEVICSRAKSFGVAVKVYGRDFEALDIVFEKAGMRFDIKTSRHMYRDVRIPLLGVHQAMNCALAAALCEEIYCEQGANGTEELDSVLRAQLAQIKWPGRLEVLSPDPFIMLDACINRASCEDVLETAHMLGISKATVVIGIPDDKDYAGVASKMFSIAESIILTKSDNPHYVFTDKQAIAVREAGADRASIEVVYMDNLEEAIFEARKRSKPVIILGTTSVVAATEKIFSMKRD